ncbi:MAG: DUF1080 domain-containing protein [Aureliella sp.]
MKSLVFPMHRLALGLLALTLSPTSPFALAQEKPADERALDKPLEAGFVALFDEKNLDGWEGNLDFFRVEQRAIVAGSLKKDIPNNEFLCTKKEYNDFELRLEVKLQGAGNNAGVQFRSARVPEDHEVSGYQCDVGVAWDRPVWGGLYDESRRNKMLAEGPAGQLPEWVKEGDWNELWIRAVGDNIELFVNGHPTIKYTEQESQIARSGIIGLQIHSGPPTEAWYRNIRIKVIDDK